MKKSVVFMKKNKEIVAMDEKEATRGKKGTKISLRDFLIFSHGDAETPFSLICF